MTVARAAYVSSSALLATLLLLRLGQAFTNWDGVDFDVYRRAATSWIAEGNPYLYGGTAGIETYRYAPWFAALWMPLAGVAREPLVVVWMVCLLLATASIMVGLVREHGAVALPLALLAGALLTSSTAGGNVQPLVVAILYFGIDRRSGPLWVGLAASLKFVPILYVIPWVMRGEWWKAAIAVLVALILLAPMLLFRLPGAALDPGGGAYPSLALWGLLAGGSLAGAVLLGRTRYARLAAGTAAVLGIPRLLALDLSVILPAARTQK